MLIVFISKYIPNDHTCFLLIRIKNIDYCLPSVTFVWFINIMFWMSCFFAQRRIRNGEILKFFSHFIEIEHTAMCYSAMDLSNEYCFVTENILIIWKKNL